MDKMKTYSVNLTAEEWSFIIGELHQRKQNEVEDGYIQANPIIYRLKQTKNN